MFDGLTAHQSKAVSHLEGPLLVLAGPGSGKTRVITHRIANLLREGVHPSQILGLTFTNKAAREMSERVDHLLQGTRVQVSTFHRFCARLLRQFAPAVGLKENFTILDQSDQIQLVRRIMKDEGLDSVFHDPGRVLSRISRARNDLLNAEMFRQHFESRVGDALSAVVYQVYPHYEQRVLDQNAVDFDDLLLHVVWLLESDAEIREALDDQFRYLLVDEYQDTNRAQYRIIQALSRRHLNLCATGDPDQSIYGWRGARPENISDFLRDFPGVQVISLDRNFRSTRSIVRCADELISQNVRPHRKQAESPHHEGDAVRLVVYEDGDTEAAGIADEIAAAVQSGERSWSDFAVLYRVNALSRSLETAFAQRLIPFQVAAGFSFYERAEIRDLIAWLRLIENFADSSAMERIINRPARGIGAKTLARLTAFARKKSMSLFEAARNANAIDGIGSRAAGQLHGFVDLIERLHELSGDGRVAPVLERLISEIDYLALWRESEDSVDSDRLANIHELISAARQFDESESHESLHGLQGFLELAGLTSEADSVDASRGAVTLLTIHAAKGLEFRDVYIVALENNIIPHERAVRTGDPAGFEEERRLLFVGMTRAKKRLTLTQTRERVFRGARRTTISSPYVSEVPSLVRFATEVPLLAPAEAIAAIDDRLAAARKRFEAAQRNPERPLLMTAAQLHARNSGEQTSAMEFTEGMQVRHPRYGRGVVTSVSAGTSRSTVSVQFELDGRSETFVAGMAPLQPVGL